MEHPALPKPQMPKREKLGRNTICALLVVVAILSATLLRGVFSSAETYRSIYQTLDERQNNVLSLAFGSAFISSVISALPDDMGTALSSEYADFYTGFAIVVSALLLEKYLLTTFGFCFFALIVPICCILGIASLFRGPHDPARYKFRQTARKLLVFGAVLFLMTPVSVFISRQIDETYRASVEATIESTEEATNAMSATDEEADADDEEGKDDPLAFLQQQINGATAAVTGAIDSVGAFATSIFPWAMQQLRNYAELFAVMVVTSIVIPVLVPVVVYLVFKILFLGESDVTIPSSVISALSTGTPLPPGTALATVPPAPPAPVIVPEGSRAEPAATASDDVPEGTDDV